MHPGINDQVFDMTTKRGPDYNNESNDLQIALKGKPVLVVLVFN
jgi:hypothetical protein